MKVRPKDWAKGLYVKEAGDMGVRGAFVQCNEDGPLRGANMQIREVCP